VLMASGTKPRRILHLWSVTVEQQCDSPESTFERPNGVVYYSLLYLAQALAHVAAARCRICVVTNNLYAVVALRLSGRKATVLGPAAYPAGIHQRGVSQYRILRCPRLDHTGTNGRGGTIVAELKATDSAAKECFIVAGAAGLQTLIRSARKESRGCANAGVYLLTGATGVSVARLRRIWRVLACASCSRQPHSAER